MFHQHGRKPFREHDVKLRQVANGFVITIDGVDYVADSEELALTIIQSRLKLNAQTF